MAADGGRESPGARPSTVGSETDYLALAMGAAAPEPESGPERDQTEDAERTEHSEHSEQPEQAEELEKTADTGESGGPNDTVRSLERQLSSSSSRPPLSSRQSARPRTGGSELGVLHEVPNESKDPHDLDRDEVEANVAVGTSTAPLENDARKEDEEDKEGAEDKKGVEEANQDTTAENDIDGQDDAHKGGEGAGPENLKPMESSLELSQENTVVQARLLEQHAPTKLMRAKSWFGRRNADAKDILVDDLEDESDSDDEGDPSLSEEERKKRRKRRAKKRRGSTFRGCQDCLKSIVRKIMWELFGIAVFPISKEEYLMGRYTHGNDVLELFRKLRLKRKEQMQWLELWANLDADGNNAMDFDEFCAFFGYGTHDRDRVWVKRIFGLMSRDMNGQVSFEDFCVFAWRYCPLDPRAAMEFAFRLVSRQGAYFKRATSIIDWEDIRNFLRFRYPDMRPLETKKRAILILEMLDDDDSGGCDFQEFIEYANEKNLSFASFAMPHLERLRQHLFGDEYWIKHTQRLSDVFKLNIPWFDKVTKHRLKIEEAEKGKGRHIFGLDFPGAKRLRMQRKEEMQQQRMRKQEFAAAMASKTYARMMQACYDLSRGNRKLRAAWLVWRHFTRASRRAELEDAANGGAVSETIATQSMAEGSVAASTAKEKRAAGSLFSLRSGGAKDKRGTKAGKSAAGFSKLFGGGATSVPGPSESGGNSDARGTDDAEEDDEIAQSALLFAKEHRLLQRAAKEEAGPDKRDTSDDAAAIRHYGRQLSKQTSHTTDSGGEPDTPGAGNNPRVLKKKKSTWELEDELEHLHDEAQRGDTDALGDHEMNAELEFGDSSMLDLHSRIVHDQRKRQHEQHDYLADRYLDMYMDRVRGEVSHTTRVPLLAKRAEMHHRGVMGNPALQRPNVQRVFPAQRLASPSPFKNKHLQDQEQQSEGNGGTEERGTAEKMKMKLTSTAGRFEEPDDLDHRLDGTSLTLSTHTYRHRDDDSITTVMSVSRALFGGGDRKVLPEVLPHHNTYIAGRGRVLLAVDTSSPPPARTQAPVNPHMP